MIGILAALSLVQTYNHGAPTNDEQLVLELINRARRDPTAEGVRLGIDITEGLSGGDAALVGPKPPLALNAALITACRDYAQFMWDNNYFDHVFPAPPAMATSTPSIRMTNAGYTFTAPFSNGENIATGSAHSAAALEDLLMIDAGIAGRGHRKNLLDLYTPGPARPFREIGLGFLDAPSGKSNILEFILVQDFARSDSAGPFLVGVVINDGDADNFYDAGEGMTGVTLTLSAGTWDAVTSSSGGFAVPLVALGAPGTLVSVTASGGALAGTATKSFILTGENVKVDFLAADAVDTDADGLPNYWEILFPGSADPVSDADGDSFSALQEYRFGSDPTQAGSTPSSPGGGTPPPAPPSSSSGGGGGGCGLTGLEALLLAAALARLSPRRRLRV